MSGCRSITSVWKRARSWLEFCPEIPFAIHVGCCANCVPPCPEPQIAVIESPMNTTVGGAVPPTGATGVLPPQPETRRRAAAVMARVFIDGSEARLEYLPFGNYRQGLGRPAPEFGDNLLCCRGSK